MRLEFNPTELVVNGIRARLGGPPEGPMTVVVEEDIKLPPRMVVSSKGRLVTGKEVKKDVL